MSREPMHYGTRGGSIHKGTESACHICTPVEGDVREQGAPCRDCGPYAPCPKHDEGAVQEQGEGEDCNLYLPSDNTICDKPRGHDDGIHEPDVAGLQEALERRLDVLDALHDRIMGLIIENSTNAHYHSMKGALLSARDVSASIRRAARSTEPVRLRPVLERLVAANDRYTVRPPGTDEWLLAAKAVDDAMTDARSALAALPDEPVRLRDEDLPTRVVVDQHGHYWRDYGDAWSMCPVSDENVSTEPIAIYVRARWSEASRQMLRDGTLEESIDAVADALNAWDQGEAPRPDTHRHWVRILDAVAQPAPDVAGLLRERLEITARSFHAMTGKGDPEHPFESCPNPTCEKNRAALAARSTEEDRT